MHPRTNGSRTLKRRLGGALGTLVVILTATLGTYGLVSGYVLDPTSALSTTAAALVALAVIAFVAILSTIGSRGGGWLDTPYW
ncbi:hypothetical protein [Halovivax cerinus]|uniref:Uncharacterized protein n=1 Tax=Halovivax cerinus TaxID=1487865 RepID=A0ABD5NMP2_9EURY|nr:hypothetical protein [Halovivax cerinus]